ncbi:MAG: hypothetical protein ACOC44_17950 [Promethearchaeia archaeon]
MVVDLPTIEALLPYMKSKLIKEAHVKSIQEIPTSGVLARELNIIRTMMAASRGM